MNFKPVLLAFCLCACGAAHAQDEDDAPGNHSGTIAPGVRAGQLRLGQTRVQARAAMNGKPGATFALPRGYSSDLWKWTEGDSGEECAIETLYQNGRVVQIEVSSPLFKMAGMPESSLVDSWTDALGSPTRISTYAYNAARKGVSRQKYLDWTARGLALESRRDKDVSYVHTIIVHRKGVRVVADFDGTPVSR